MSGPLATQVPRHSTSKSAAAPRIRRPRSTSRRSRSSHTSRRSRHVDGRVMSELLDDCPLKSMSPDETFLMALAMAVAILAKQNGDARLQKALISEVGDWVRTKGLVAKEM